MKILKVTCNNYKLCEKNFTISLVPIANKTKEDKIYELEEIDDNLFVYNTLGIIGKNASGKTTALNLMALVYEIFSYFKVKTLISDFDYIDNDVDLDITFYHEGYLYRYITQLSKDINVVDTNIIFKNQQLFSKVYKKSNAKGIFDYDKYEIVSINDNLPADTSILYTVLNKINVRGVYCTSNDNMYRYYNGAFNIYKTFDEDFNLMKTIIKMLDDHIKNIQMLDDNKYEVIYSNNKKQILDSNGLYSVLSSGTTKGFSLFTFVVYSLKTGNDLIIDEVENHFHKALVENLINLYKDKTVNKNHATLIFSTHNCELLDLFNRDDNIYISKLKKNNIVLENMYYYNIRPDLSKANKFYQNAFDTNVDYEALMNFKKELM